MKTYIEFRSKYPDDTEFDEAGDPVMPPGRNILTAYRVFLEAQGVQVSGIDQHSHYGQCVEVDIDGVQVWQMIQHPDPWLLIAESQVFRIPGLNAKRVDRKLYESLQLLRKFLNKDTSLEFVADYTRKEYEKLNATKSAGYTSKR